MHKFRALLTGLAVLGALLVATPASASTSLTIPDPTGNPVVGTVTLHMVDQSRLDPWVPESGPRELMVSMFYPALRALGAPRQYMTTGESRLFLDWLGATTIPAEVLAGTKSKARVNAPYLAGQRPLIVLSPGFSYTRSTLTGLAEDLASHGYVVALIGHNYESYGTEFPDGHVTTCVACGTADSAHITQVRTADVKFVIDRLIGPDPAWTPAPRMIDPKRIGMAGHSIGGNSASQVMLSDRRVLAGINMDGTFFAPIPATGFNRPFMLLGNGEGHVPGGHEPSWDRDYPKLAGWKRWITFKKSDHASFTDLTVLTDQLGLSDPGGLDGARGLALTRTYVRSFFDQHLKDQARPVLNGPSPENPEADFWF
ncbi:lipase [Kribbella sp. NBC_01505]|uniref:alpha/beta hydrolase family protein n=1 Tax=Kribbella sp. NBC_01505 TaxID=2903580 RepID=UPI0038696969